LRERHIIILPDRDEAGERHAAQVAQSLYSKAASVKVLKLPNLAPKNDVSDWIAAGGTAEQLRELAAGCGEWQPSDSGDSRIVFMLAPDFVASTPEPEILIHKVAMRGDFLLVVGRPKKGKSLLALELARAVATGTNAFGALSCRKANVLLLLRDDKPHRIAARLRTMGLGDLTNVYVDTKGLSFPTDVDTLRDAMERLSIGFVVIDSRARYFQGDVNEEWQVERSMRPVVDVIHNTDAVCACVCHERKSGGEGGDEVLGSTAVYAVADGKLLLRRKDVDGQPRATLEFDSRDGGSEPLGLRLDTATLRWVAMDGGAAAIEEESARAAVWNAFKRYGAMTSADLREETGWKKSAVAKAVKELVETNLVMATGQRRGNAPIYAPCETVRPSISIGGRTDGQTAVGLGAREALAPESDDPFAELEKAEVSHDDGSD
jgi:hypothetical protein